MICRILSKEGLITPEPKKKLKSSFIRFEAAMPKGSWQASITHLYLADSTRMEVLVFLEDRSRCLLSTTAQASFVDAEVASVFIAGQGLFSPAWCECVSLMALTSHLQTGALLMKLRFLSVWSACGSAWFHSLTHEMLG